jgi:hypothetical protein
MPITVAIDDVEHGHIMTALQRQERVHQRLADTAGGSAATILAAREAVKTIQSLQKKLRAAYLAYLDSED